VFPQINCLRGLLLLACILFTALALFTDCRKKVERERLVRPLLRVLTLLNACLVLTLLERLLAKGLARDLLVLFSALRIFVVCHCELRSLAVLHSYVRYVQPQLLTPPLFLLIHLYEGFLHFKLYLLFAQALCL
jgi:hypothetical protein